MASTKRPFVFVKIDFAKAFDSINWIFLSKVMRARGLSEKWIKWIKHLLTMASSRVVVHGEGTRFFQHKSGLHQGDPLSPMLFILATDVLQQMVGAVNANLQTVLSPKMKEPILAMQYADDTAFGVNVDQETLITFKLLLRLFTHISGLKINFYKSSFVSFNIAPENLDVVRAILGCGQTQLSITYLGMPMLISRLKRSDFLPLIEKLDKRLQG